MGSCIVLLLFGSLHIAQATMAYKMVTNINAGAFWATTIVSSGFCHDIALVMGFYEIFSLNYALGAATCSRSLFRMHTLPGAYLIYTPEAFYIQNTLLEHICFRKLLQIIHAPGTHMIL